MSSDTLVELLEMDGYALYVWGSFAMVAGAAIWEALMLVQRRRRALEDLHELRRLRTHRATQATATEPFESPEHAA